MNVYDNWSNQSFPTSQKSIPTKNNDIWTELLSTTHHDMVEMNKCLNSKCLHSSYAIKSLWSFEVFYTTKLKF